MKKKWPGTLLIIGVFILVVFLIPLALFSTLPGTFTPPAPGTEAARVPELPYVSEDAPGPVVGDAPVGEATPHPDNQPVAAEIASGDLLQEPLVAKLVAAYRKAHPDESAEANYLYPREGVPTEFSEMALAVLKGEDSAQAYLALLEHPVVAVRCATVRGLLEAENALRQDGAAAMIALLAGASEQERNRLVRAAVELLIADTEAGRSSNAQGLLMFLGDYAQPAIPHLAWVSRNHPNPNMRVWTMNVANLLDPNSEEAGALISERLLDADGGVRLQVLQAWVLRPLARYGRDAGNVSPIYLQRPPGETPDAPTVEENEPAQKSAMARAA